VEVMVALVVISIGLLGIAKMQALALSSTGTAKTRALASIEAASLASTLRADRTYWSTIPATLTIDVASTAVVTATPDNTLNNAPGSHCATVAPACTSAQIAAQDLSDWAQTLTTVLPGGTAKVVCTVDAAGVNPVSCSILLRWNENVVALNTANNAGMTAAQNKAALAATQPTQYTLYVEP
jgi:type IV pilus assembly protein PilV